MRLWYYLSWWTRNYINEVTNITIHHHLQVDLRRSRRTLRPWAMLRLESSGKNSSFVFLFSTRNVQRLNFQGFIQKFEIISLQRFKLSKLNSFFFFKKHLFLNLDCSLVAIDVATSFNLELKKTSQEAQEAVAQALQVLKEFYAKVFGGWEAGGGLWSRDATNPNSISALFLGSFLRFRGVSFDRQKNNKFQMLQRLSWLLENGWLHFHDSDNWCLATSTRARRATPLLWFRVMPRRPSPNRHLGESRRKFTSGCFCSNLNSRIFLWNSQVHRHGWWERWCHRHDGGQHFFGIDQIQWNRRGFLWAFKFAVAWPMSIVSTINRQFASM